MPSKQLTVLFTPLDGWGHINASHGLAEAVRDRGHRVVFAIDSAFEGKLKNFGFEEEIHSIPKDPNADPNINFWADFIVKHKEVFLKTPIEIVEKMCCPAFETMFEGYRKRDEQYIDIISRVKPDIIIIDSYIGSPTLTNSGIPWIWLYSAAPHLCLLNDKIPPGWSGLPLNGDKNVWKEFREKFEHIFNNLHNNINKWMLSSGASALHYDCGSCIHPESEYLNVYMYPKEMDYKEVQPLPQNWRRVDGFVRKTDEKFEIPECLRDKSGKLVFLSMGSFGCANLDLMNRLIGILSKSEHRFIVSKGPLHDKLTLADNMWGQAFVPQTAVLPVVDLVITHGGNNTMTETFFNGKPVLVMPIFGDQFDNAQRVQEVGLGLRLNPFECSEDELLSSVDRLVNDLELKERMKTIGERIRSNNDKEMIAHLIEEIVDKKRNNKTNSELL